ncbi:hypothetical protein [Aestuariivivens insulae]|uniref:hypothetical protein n=1 Tax=Aestuariivivens insulae TaxID=1621988 RepID=UPI001F59A8F3|nr:hypothetical protein [Aestuariivivens insulae]
MKKRCLLLTFFLISSLQVIAQQNYTVNGETLFLDIEVEGDLDLLTLKLYKGYRFFVKDTNDNIHELINTKDIDGTYFNEFRYTLQELTKGSNMSTELVAFGKYSLKQFIKAYNKKGNRRYAYTNEKVETQIRLGGFVGLTNHPLVENYNNRTTSYFGAELELLEKKERPWQSGFLSVERTLKSNDFKYTSTILALGYRFRFINPPSSNIYINLQLATFTFSKETTLVGTKEITEKNHAFRIPFIFGLGSDIKISDTSYITLIYNEIIAVLAKNKGHFPINFLVGYKFSL